jgi:hypothetical protein
MGNLRKFLIILFSLCSLVCTTLSAQQLNQVQKGTAKDQIPVTNGPQFTQVYRAAKPYILDSRNDEALNVLRQEISKGHKKIGIFYGAAHLKDFELNIEEDEYFSYLQYNLN